MTCELLALLRCPDCREGFLPPRTVPDTLVCQGCQKNFPIVHGVPQLISSRSEAQSLNVADSFARQWEIYREQRDEYRWQFLDWIAPVTQDFFRGKVILDAGCGKGRHLTQSSNFGAKLVIGVDLGFGSTQVAQQAHSDRKNVAVIRADITNLPFASDTFDYAYSIGVLHHLPDPECGFRSVLDKVKSGGHISAWVYGLENNEWLENWVTPVRENLTSKLPPVLLRAISKALATILKTVGHGIYQPILKVRPDARLFYQAYLLNLCRLPLKEVETIVYDHLHPAISHYLSRERFTLWFEDLTEVSIGWHNQNSWRGFARKP